jgi:hypothetical protein
MAHRKLIAGMATLLLAFATSAAVASPARAPAPKRATIKAVTSFQVKINRWIKDGLRWNKDTYLVRPGGTLHIVNKAADEGPHTFTVVKKKDLPRTARQIFNCRICQQLGEAHGADPNSDAPPQHLFLENGVGQDTPPNVDRPGDSAVTGPNDGDSLDLTVTAPAGKTLRFMCLIHPWMQGKVLVRRKR